MPKPPQAEVRSLKPGAQRHNGGMRLAATLVLAGSLVAGPAWAQDPQAQPQPPRDSQLDTPETPAIDPTRLGVSLKRIQKNLNTKAESDRTGMAPLRLEFQVQVYGQAPKIDVLQGVDIFNGAVPGTAPSHPQMLQFWTPQAFSAPAMPISAMAFWVAQQVWKKSQKTRCEEEIAAYRSMLMQGVNIAAPRCTQQ
jgi:hypothetical protein